MIFSCLIYLSRENHNLNKNNNKTTQFMQNHTTILHTNSLKTSFLFLFSLFFVHGFQKSDKNKCFM